MSSPDQKAVRLLDIADMVDSARRLVEAGHMATEDLSDDQRDPLAELLREIATRLENASADLRHGLRGVPA